MSNPSSAGIGQGAAQVFDNRGTINMYARMAERNQLIAQRDAQAAADMLKGYDPQKNGIRTSDIPEYNNLYNQLKDIYINNKKLYVNPASNIEKYKEAESIAARMRQMAADSKYLDKFYGEVGDAYLKDKDKFEDGSMTDLLATNQLPTNQIKEKFGGRLPGLEDIKYKPKPVDIKKYTDWMHGTMDAMSGSFDFEQRIAPGAEGYNVVTPIKHYKPESVVEAYNYAKQALPEINKEYRRKFDELTPDQLGMMQQALDTKMGPNSWKIDDHEKLGVADFVLNFSSVAGKSENQLDKAYQRQMDDQRSAREQREALGRMRQQFEYSLQLQKERGSKAEKSSDDQLMVDSENIVNTLASIPNDTKDLDAKNVQKLALQKLGTFGKVEYVHRGRYKTEALKEKIEKYNATQKNESFQIDVSTPEKLKAVQDAGYIRVATTGGDYMISLADPMAKVNLYNLFKIAGEKVKAGVKQNIEGQDQ